MEMLDNTSYSEGTKINLIGLKEKHMSLEQLNNSLTLSLPPNFPHSLYYTSITPPSPTTHLYLSLPLSPPPNSPPSLYSPSITPPSPTEQLFRSLPLYSFLS